MKQTTHFNINVPELGDRPDITQVSDAISALEDATSGMPEYMNASIQGGVITFSSNTRATKRTKYYDGLTIMFEAPAQIEPNSVTRAKVDNLGEQTISIPFLVASGESILVTYSGSSFKATRFNVPKDNSVASTSSETVATSLAVKTAYDKAVEAYNKAGTVDSTLSGNKADKSTQVIAGNGLTGGGDLSTNRTINVVSADDGIVINQDNIKLNTTDDIATISSTRPASATAVKKAYDKGNEALSSANSKLEKSTYNGTAQTLKNDIDGKVNKAGDTMTGDLRLNTGVSIRVPKPNEPGAYSWVFGELNGILYAGENVLPLKIRSKDNPTIAVNNEPEKRIYHEGFKPTPASIGASREIVLSDFVLNGNQPESGGTNAFTVKVPLSRNGFNSFNLNISGGWSYFEFCGTVTYSISALCNIGSDTIASSKITCLSDNTRTKVSERVLRVGDLRRDADYLYIDFHFSANRTYFMCSFTPLSGSPSVSPTIENIRTEAQFGNFYTVSGSLGIKKPETKLLWSGALNSVGQVATLNESDTRFDMIIASGGWTGTPGRSTSCFTIPMITRTIIEVRAGNRKYHVGRDSDTRYRIIQANDGDIGADMFTNIWGINF